MAEEDQFIPESFVSIVSNIQDCELREIEARYADDRKKRAAIVAEQGGVSVSDLLGLAEKQDDELAKYEADRKLQEESYQKAAVNKIAKFPPPPTKR